MLEAYLSGNNLLFHMEICIHLASRHAHVWIVTKVSSSLCYLQSELL